MLRTAGSPVRRRWAARVGGVLTVAGRPAANGMLAACGVTSPSVPSRSAAAGSLIEHRSGKMHLVDNPVNSRRAAYPYILEMQRECWPMLKDQMVSYFSRLDEYRATAVSMTGVRRPKFVSNEQVMDLYGMTPCVIGGYGNDVNVMLPTKQLESIAFDEERGHVSLLLQARVFRLKLREAAITGSAPDAIKKDTCGGHPDGVACVVEDYKAHPVNKQLYSIKFKRLHPDAVTVVKLPVTLVNVYGCPAFRAGAEVQLATPTVDIEVLGAAIPPPLLADCQKVPVPPEVLGAYGSLNLQDLRDQVERFPGVRVARSYGDDLRRIEVVHAYRVKHVPRHPVPLDYVDPNFLRKDGNFRHYTYVGFRPRQGQRPKSVDSPKFQKKSG